MLLCAKCLPADPSETCVAWIDEKDPGLEELASSVQGGHDSRWFLRELFEAINSPSNVVIVLKKWIEERRTGSTSDGVRCEDGYFNSGRLEVTFTVSDSSASSLQDEGLGDSWDRSTEHLESEILLENHSADEYSPFVEDWGAGSWLSTEATFTASSL